MRTTEDIYRREILPRIVKDIPKSISKYRVNIKKEQEVVEDYKFVMESVKSFKFLLINEEYNNILTYDFNVDVVGDFEVTFPHDEDLIEELDFKHNSWSRFLYVVSRNNYEGSISSHKGSSLPHSEYEINTLIDLLLPSDRMLMFEVTLWKIKYEEQLIEDANSENSGGNYEYVGDAFSCHMVNPVLSLKSFCFIALTRDVNKSNPKVYNILWSRMNDEERLSCYLYRKTIFGENKVGEARRHFKGKYQIFMVDPKYMNMLSAKEAEEIRDSHLSARDFTFELFGLAYRIMYNKRPTNVQGKDSDLYLSSFT